MVSRILKIADVSYHCCIFRVFAELDILHINADDSLTADDTFIAGEKFDPLLGINKLSGRDRISERELTVKSSLRSESTD